MAEGAIGSLIYKISVFPDESSLQKLLHADSAIQQNITKNALEDIHVCDYDSTIETIECEAESTRHCRFR